MKSLMLVRRINARPSIVFEVLTRAEEICAWWGPEAVPVVYAESDPRVGGLYRVHFQTLDGRAHEAHGEYLELTPPRRIVMTWRYAFGGEPDEEGRVSRIEIDLIPIPEGTELTFKHSDLASDTSKERHTWGWTGALSKLVSHAETRD